MFSVSTKNHPAMQSDLLQQELFDHIRTVMPANRSLADAIADLLRISPDSAYRRIRGEKSLSFSELQKLSTHFRISMDSILNIDSRSSVFYGNWLRAKGFNFEEYLGGLLESVEKVASAAQCAMYYEAKDFFPPHYLPFPELAAFKYFFWLRSVLHIPAYAEMKFEDHDLGDILAKLSPAILKSYNEIPATEVWSDDSLTSTLHQIAYCKRAGIIRDSDTVARLHGQMNELLEHARSQAAAGKKFLPGEGAKPRAEFKLYYNAAYLGHNTILTEADGLETVFVNHCVLNMMTTNDPEFCRNTRRYFEETAAGSVLISREHGEERDRFFDCLQERIQNVQECTKKKK